MPEVTTIGSENDVRWNFMVWSPRIFLETVYGLIGLYDVRPLEASFALCQDVDTRKAGIAHPVQIETDGDSATDSIVRETEGLTCDSDSSSFAVILLAVNPCIEFGAPQAGDGKTPMHSRRQRHEKISSRKEDDVRFLKVTHSVLKRRVEDVDVGF
jgi:hypothetical protein